MDKEMVKMAMSGPKPKAAPSEENGEALGIPLQEFFAVTTTSLYRVCAQRDKNHSPVVEKLAIRKGVDSTVGVGATLKNGNFVGVTTEGIILYFEDFSPYSEHKHTQRPEEVNTAYWGGHTSPIVGLFLREESARQCLKASYSTRLDPRWQKETAEALAAIGENHPVFVVSRETSLAFPKLITQPL